MLDCIAIFNSLLTLAVENGASDIHLKTDKTALFRIDGCLETVDMEALPADVIDNFITRSVPASFLDQWKENNQVDFSYGVKGIGRFRVNAFLQRGTPSMVFRHIKDTPPTFEDLNIDGEILTSFCEKKNGIFLLCGATGSGKSSTMAAMLNYINVHYDRHIVTLEDPIEFTYTDEMSHINQREVGIDTPSFELGLKAVLRQDPDIILVGEMRDRDTFETALNAAETGHLVFGTLHASNAQQAVQRLFDFFPVEQQNSMRRQIAGSLIATVTQKLIPLHQGGGRVPAQEVMVMDALMRELIADGEFEKILTAIEADSGNGSRTFNSELIRLVEADLINKETAMKFSPNPRQLEMNLKGIYLSSGGIV